MKDTLKVLFFGDVVGDLGCVAFQKHVDKIKNEHDADFIIVNGENSHSNGRGITPRLVAFFKHNGADLVTSGNHVFARKEISEYLSQNDDLLRPANFPRDCPGKGYAILSKGAQSIAVMNLQGRIFMRELVGCPFKEGDAILRAVKQKTKCVFIDFHAETTSEKIGIAHHFDGQVSGVVGTHTHVQTADERVLDGGTAFITDLGMCGALNGMLGMQKDVILKNMLTQMPQRFAVDNNPPAVLSGVCIEVNAITGKAVKIERFRVIDNDLSVL